MKLRGAAILLLVLARCSTLMAGDGDDSVPKTAWKPGNGLSIDLDNFQLRIGARLQIRETYTVQDYCGDCVSTLTKIQTTDIVTGVTTTTNSPPVTTTLGDPVTGDSLQSTNLAVRRLKLIFAGWAFDPRFKYDIQFESTAGEQVSNIGLREAFIDLQFAPPLQVKVGQWKGPYGRQRIMSDGNLQFVDLSIATQSFAMGFEDGVMIHGTFGGPNDDRFEYNAGVFNGRGQNPPLAGETDRSPLWAARFVAMPLGIYPYAESSPDNPDHFLFFVGGSWNTNTRTASVRVNSTGTELESRADWVGFETGGKYKVFNFAGEYFRGRADADARNFDPIATPSTPAVLVSTTQTPTRPLGWYAQIGLFAIPRILEFAIRASRSDPNTDLKHQGRYEERFGINWYISKSHPQKLQTDFGVLRQDFNGTVVEGDPGNPSADNRDAEEKQFRIQYQFWF